MRPKRKATKTTYKEPELFSGDEGGPVRVAETNDDNFGNSADERASENENDDFDDGDGEFVDDSEAKNGLAGGKSFELNDSITASGVSRYNRQLGRKAQDADIYQGTSWEDAYFGPLRDARTRVNMRRFAAYTYGPNKEDIDIVFQLYNRWANEQVFPSKSSRPSACSIPSPWVPPGFWAVQQGLLKSWFQRMENDPKCGNSQQSTTALTYEEARSFFPEPTGRLAVVIGTASSATKSQTVVMNHCQARTILKDEVFLTSETEQEAIPMGWLFDVGGQVTSMAWAPIASYSPQVLALAIRGGKDPSNNDQNTENLQNECQPYGMVQFWECVGEKTDQEFTRLSKAPARLRKGLCFASGRARQLVWCPIPLQDDTAIGILAILLNNGVIHVIKVSMPDENETTTFERLDSAMVTLYLEGEANCHATCLTWVNTNRIASGHADGSVVLWSLYPRMVLARRLLHQTPVLNISSGYPSHPYHVASSALAGYIIFIDLSAPGFEFTSFPLFGIGTQPNVLEWGDHLNGWYFVRPSQRPFKSLISYVHVRSAPNLHSAFLSDSDVTAMASGFEHPFLLLGAIDGTVWNTNPSRKLYTKRHVNGYKAKLLEHEYRPREIFPDTPRGSEDGAGGDGLVVDPTIPLRGAARIWTGFDKVENLCNAGTLSQKVLIKRKQRGLPKDADLVEEGEDDFSAGEGGGKTTGPKSYKPLRAVVHEPLTRITAVAWDPNPGFSCWGAAAMASGLVRVMDLGLED